MEGASALEEAITRVILNVVGVVDLNAAVVVQEGEVVNGRLGVVHQSSVSALKKELKSTVKTTPMNPTKKVGTMQDTTTAAITITATMTKVITMTDTVEGMAITIITGVSMAGVEGSGEEEAEDALQTHWVELEDEAKRVVSMVTAKDKPSPRKATVEKDSSLLEAIPA